VMVDIDQRMLPMYDGQWIQLLAGDQPGTRAIAWVSDIRMHECAEDAIRERGDGVLMPGESVEDYFVDRGSPPRTGPVVSYELKDVQVAPALRADVPRFEDGMRLYDVLYFQGLSGDMGVVSVHAHDLDAARRMLTLTRAASSAATAVAAYEAKPNPAAAPLARSGRPSQGPRGGEEGSAVSDVAATNVAALEAAAQVSGADVSANQALSADAQTRVVLHRLVPGQKPERIGDYGFSSGPLLVYMGHLEFLDNPEVLRTDTGLEIPWRGQRVLLTQGREAIRCLLYRAFGHLVLVYERQIEVMPIALLKDGAGVSCELTICNPEITIKLFEAANALLHDEGDVAMVAVYTPETTSTTTNHRIGWFVVEGNIPEDRVLSAYRETAQESVALEDRKAAAAHLRASWRNFVHARFEDGRQVVIMDTRMRTARRAAELPLKNAKLRESGDQGGIYMATLMLRTARRAVKTCSQHATLQQRRPGESRADPLHDTLPLFFDQDGCLRYRALLDIFRRSFTERTRKDGGLPWLQIDGEFVSALDGVEPRLIKYESPGGLGVQDLILSGKKTAENIHEAYMERFIRALITTIYVNYGTHGNVVSARMDRRQLAHLIYRAGLTLIELREKIYTFLATAYTWLEARQADFPAELRRVWDDAMSHCNPQTRVHARGRGSGSVARAGQPSLHKDLFIAYVMNRSNDKFGPLADYLSALRTEWVLSKRAAI
jgi:hypothetical protein